MPRGESENNPEFDVVSKRLRYTNGIPIGTSNINPLLDTRIYEVKYTDRYNASLTANIIAMNMFAQVDDEGTRYVLFVCIVDHRNDGTNVKVKDSYIEIHNSGRRRGKRTKGWKMLAMCKYGSNTWVTSKDMKKYYHIQVSEYAIQSSIASEPVFV